MTRRRSLWVAAAISIAACNQQESVDQGLADPQLAALAGRYTRGAHMTWTETLTIDAAGRFDRSSRGCAGATQYSGRASREGDWIILDGLPDDPAKAKEIEKLGVNRLRVVAWGNRTYLIEDIVMRGFCESVNAGWEPRDSGDGEALLREADWLTAATGLPDVPPEWTPWLLHKELRGTVTEVRDDGLAWVDFGADDGLLVGMKLTLRDVPVRQRIIDLGGPSLRNEPLEVAELEAARCLVQLQYPMNSPSIEVGMRVTSRAIDRP